MRGAVQLLLLVLYMGQLLAPAIIITDFFVDRERIERDLCVQRERAEQVRTCHGECHMVKQLRAAEDAAAQHTPPSLPLKTQPEWFGEQLASTGLMDVTVFLFPDVAANLHGGMRRVAEPVPWC